jgi:outer membrane immunogenic protein
MFPKMSARHVAFGLFAAAAATGFGESTAQAQYAPPPVPPSAFAWNGGYVGLNAGAAGGADAISESGSSTSFGPFGFGVTTAGSGTMTAFGGTAGLAAGYNWQGLGWLFGIEADASYVGLHGSQDMTAANFSFVTEHDSFQTSWLSTVRGRAGYIWGNWLLYMTAGAAIGDHKYNGVIRAFGIANPSGNVIKAGWTLGLGTEWMFAPAWTVKVEYLFADLGSETFTANVFNNKVSVTGRLTEDMVRLGLNYKLGW